MARQDVSPIPSMGGPERTLIKRNVKRSVYAETAPDGSQTMLKVFHAPGLGRWRDGLRARREERCHRAARAAELPCAPALGVERVEGRWALRLGWIHGAETISHQLETRPRSRGLMARHLGELARALERAGFVHADPHPGNLLIDSSGTLHLADLAGARLSADAAGLGQQWVEVCAGLRELDPRLLVAANRHWRRLGGGESAADARDIDRRARTLRAQQVARRVRVWRRTSSSTEVRSRNGQSVVEARRGPQAGWKRTRMEGSAAETAATWATLVRGTLHRLPCAAPLVCALEAPWFVEYAAPMDAGERSDAAPDGQLERLLEHRGLRAEGHLMALDERTWIGPHTTLVAVEHGRSGGAS